MSLDSVPFQLRSPNWHPEGYRHSHLDMLSPPALLEVVYVDGRGGGAEPQPLHNYFYNNASSTGRAPFACSRCGRSYRSIKTRNRHMRHECGVDKQFECALCGHKAQRSDGLLTHIRSQHPNYARSLPTRRRCGQRDDSGSCFSIEGTWDIQWHVYLNQRTENTHLYLEQYSMYIGLTNQRIENQ